MGALRIIPKSMNGRLSEVIESPVLDVGCGIKANLVELLRSTPFIYLY